MEDASNSEHSNSSDEWADLTKSEYAKVIFHQLSWDVKSGSLHCTFSVTESVTKSPRDCIGLFKVGYENLSQCLVFKYLSEIESENIKLINCCFKAEELPELNGFYQFCYITQDQEICGASMPIEIKHLNCKICSMNDVITEGVEDDFLMVRHGLEKWNLELQDTLKTKEEENQILKAKILEFSNEKEEHTRQLESILSNADTESLKYKVENGELKLKLDMYVLDLKNVTEELELLKKHIETQAETLKTVEHERSILKIKVGSITMERDNFAAALDYKASLYSDTVKQRDFCKLTFKSHLESYAIKLEALTKEKEDLLEKLENVKIERSRYKCENIALKIQCEEYLSSDWPSKFKAKEEELNNAKLMLKAVEESKLLAIDEIKKLKEKLNKVPYAKPNSLPKFENLLDKQLNFCKSILKNTIYSKKLSLHAWPFYLPVDVNLLNIPDYLQVIKHPMDFGTIEKKLANNEYKSPDEFASDVYLIFSNCYQYNPPDHNLVCMAKKVQKVFDRQYVKMPQKLSSSSSESVSGSESEKENKPKSRHDLFKMDSIEKEIKSRKKVKVKSKDKLLIKEQLKYCQSILTKLLAQEGYVYPFLNPVDVRRLSDYHEIIKHPMDFRTIENKLANKEYRSADEFAKDVRLVFTNCYRYYSPGDILITMARKVQNVFENEYVKMPVKIMQASSCRPIDVLSSTSESDDSEIFNDENKPPILPIDLSHPQYQSPIHLKQKKDDKIRSLKLKAAELECKYEAECSKLVTMAEQIEDYKDRFVKITSELNALKDELIKSKEENVIKENEIAVLEKEVTVLKDKIFYEIERREQAAFKLKLLPLDIKESCVDKTWEEMSNLVYEKMSEMQKNSLKKDAKIASMENQIKCLENAYIMVLQNLRDKTARLLEASEVYKSLYVEKALLSKKLKKIMKNRSLDGKCAAPVVQASQLGSLAISCEESTSNNSDSDTGERVRSPTAINIQDVKSVSVMGYEMFGGAKLKTHTPTETAERQMGLTKSVVNEKAVQDKNPVQVGNPESKVESLKEDESTIRCSMCEALFAASPLSNTPMLKHYEMEHNMDMCPLCGQLFDRSLPRQYLQFHVDSHFLST